MHNRPRVFASCVLFVLIVYPALAQQSGGIPLRIAGGPPPQCINSSTDRVWLTLYRIITTKQNHFLSRENSAQILLNVQVKTDPQPSQPIAYPLSTQVNLRSYSAGQVSLPVEYALVSGLPLRQKDSAGNLVTYTGFGVDTTLVNVRSPNGLGTALQALSDITGSNKLPIPNSPYTQAAGYLLQFANRAIAADIKNKNADDKLTTAALSLNFDPDGKCAGNGDGGEGFETTGTKAILMARGMPGNLIPIEQTGDYCWTADSAPAVVVKAAKKIAGKPCGDLTYASLYKPITNDYVAFFLQKRLISTNLSRDPRTERDIADSKRLCRALGLSKCPAAEN